MPYADANRHKVTSPALVATPTKLMTVEERADGEVEIALTGLT